MGFPKVGDQLPLEMKVAGQKLADLPVQVTQIQKTANDINIEFGVLPGHRDGPGSTIHFRFHQEGGQMHLGIRGYITEGPGSGGAGPLGPLEGVAAPVERNLYTAFADTVVWQQYIDRLMYNIKSHPSGPPVTQA